MLFALAVRAVTTGIGTMEGIALFLVTVVVSGVVGVAGGIIANQAIGWTRERPVQLAITVVLAYGAYQLAAVFGLSGILATVISGIVLGTLMRRSPTSALAGEVEDLWDVIAFALTSLVSLLIGFAIALAALGSAAVGIIIGTIAAIVARGFIVYVPALVARLMWRARALPRGWDHVVFWSGLRGAIALAAALSLPADFPQRDLLQEISLGIVLGKRWGSPGSTRNWTAWPTEAYRSAPRPLEPVRGEAHAGGSEPRFLWRMTQRRYRRVGLAG